MFGYLQDVDLFTLKFHVLDNIVKAVSRIEDLVYLYAYLYKHFIFTIRKFTGMISMHRGAMIEEAVLFMNVPDTFTEYIATKTFES